MKKFVIFVFLAVTGCVLFGPATNSSLSVSLKLDDINGDNTHAYYSFSQNSYVTPETADIGIEPWWSNGNPAPALQLLSSWGDSTKFIKDLGVMSLDDAANLTPSTITPPDSSQQYDWWTIDKPQIGHSYFLITKSGAYIFFHINNISITTGTDTNGYSVYSAEFTIDYVKK